MRCSKDDLTKETPHIALLFICFVSKIKILNTENPQVPTLGPQHTGHLSPWKPREGPVRFKELPTLVG